MKQLDKKIDEIKKSLSSNFLTIFSGLYSANKDYIVKEFISTISKENNLITLNFSILNFNRFYTETENLDYVLSKIDNTKNNVVVIFEFTNLINWSEFIEKLSSINNLKVIATTSINFSAAMTFTKIKKFRLNFNEIQYLPPTYHEYCLGNDNANIDNYLKYGSLIVDKSHKNDDLIYDLVYGINIIRLFSIFLILTKVRSHFQLEVFYNFLVQNIDQKLTIEFIKNNIKNYSGIMMNNGKTTWKYINLLQNLYILIPINSYCPIRKSYKSNSRFICVDHMMFRNVATKKNKKNLIIRNILISEFLKRKLDVFIIEDNKINEPGFFVNISKLNKLLFIFDETSEVIKKFIDKEIIEEENIINVSKNITNKELEIILNKIEERVKKNKG